MMNSLDDWDKQDLNLWRNLFSEYSVVQAALLIVGASPSRNNYILTDSPDIRPLGFDAAFMALKQEIMNRNEFKATVRRAAHLRGWNEEPEDDEVFTKNVKPYPDFEDCFDIDKATLPIMGIIYKNEPDWEATTINKTNLKKWLEERNIKPDFFFPENMSDNSNLTSNHSNQKNNSEIPAYLDKDHPNKSLKLIAAIHAWEAVNDNPGYQNNGKSVKQNIQQWLKDNAEAYKLLNDNGTINKQAIEEQISPIVNWDGKGGATPTPVKKRTSLPTG